VRNPNDIAEIERLKKLLNEAIEIARDAISQESSGWPEGELSYFDRKNGWTEGLRKIVVEFGEKS
jgi:hypothetical protein